MEPLAILLVFLFLIYLAFGLDWDDDQRRHDENAIRRHFRENGARQSSKITIDSQNKTEGED